MTSRTTLHLLFASLVGCASTHTIDTTPEPLTALESCLADGGRLQEVASVDNDDVTEHGDLRTLAVDGSGRIAVSADDGTIKLWTMEGFITAFDPRLLTYGAELDGTPANDLLFDASGRVVAGDGRGTVTAWHDDGVFDILGGTDPDQSIVAVAIDPSGAWLAHADARAGGNVMLRALDGTETVGPLATELASVRDLALLGDGALVVAGSGIEIRSAGAPTDVRARASVGEVVEVATAADHIAAVTSESVSLLDRDASSIFTVDAPAPVGVAITEHARFVITAGADGSLRVFGDDGAQITAADVADPVVVRIDPRGSAVVTGSRDGVVRAFECVAP